MRKGVSAYPACVCVLVLSVALGAPAALAQSTPVTVTILRFIEVQDPDPVQVVDAIDNPDTIGHGDYYAEVRIDDNPSERNRSDFVESTDFQPFWTFSRTINGSGIIPVVIRMWDADDIENNDDIIDLNPQDTVQELVLNLDLKSCTWTGDAGENGTFAQGDGDKEHTGMLEGGEAGKILFDVACSQSGDIDKDGIPDGVERFGIRDGDGKLVADMAALGADPCRLNIAVEIDFMETPGVGHTHRPTAGVITELVNAFDNAGTLVPTLAPGDCPYRGFPTQTGGVGLILVLDDAIPEQETISKRDLATIRKDNFDRDLAPYFHYALIGHKLSEKAGGWCCEGKNFLITLGAGVGNNRRVAGTFMHELGHALGLTHGGGRDIDRDRNGNATTRNCKPNYLSVMNYSFQTVGLTDAATGNAAIDFSRRALPSLNERVLNEELGILDEGAMETTWANASGVQQFDHGVSTAPGVLGNSGLDWDWNGSIGFGQNPDDRIDLTAIPGRTECGQDRAQPPNPISTPDDILNGWNDWANLRFRAAMAAGTGEDPGVFDDELTVEEAHAIEEAWARHMRCNPPDAGDWVIARDCTIWRDATAPADLVVENGAVLRVGSGVTLDIDLAAHALRVASRARVEVQLGGRIR